MSDTSVSIDSSPNVLAVHWNVPIAEAREHFRAVGFHGIGSISKLAVENGNAAREHARAQAIREGCFYFWQGSYDWGVEADSAIYAFTYELYTGKENQLFDGRKQ